jgi:hypothetical protein
MEFRPSNLIRLLLVMAMGAMVLPAGAQQSSQPIIFSSPKTEEEATDRPLPSPDILQPGILPGTLQAPVTFFDLNPADDSLPVPVSPSISQQQLRMRKLLADRKNWTLMTPEEILGMEASGKMLQAPERDALGREKDPTPLERYLERETRLRNGPTNDWSNDRVEQPRNFARDPDSANPPDYRRSSSADAARSFSQILNGQQTHDENADQNGNSSWETFSRPLPQAATKSDLQQLAAMERFRQLLNSSPADEAQPSSDNKFFPAPKPVMDPLLTQPDFVPNPAGASFTPLSSGIAKPTGLTPLPGAVTSLLPPVATPSWKPQLPPWLLQGPQPFVMPQQKGF